MTGYGVLRAKVDQWTREDGDRTPHLQVEVLDDSGRRWQVAVNVQSDTGSEVVYWLLDPFDGHPVLPRLGALPSGFSLADGDASAALDFVRAPIFDWRTGRALPASGHASADDLQDLLVLQLRGCRDAGGEVFAFGERFGAQHGPATQRAGGVRGVHDIHFNQGNTGAHADDNGVWHDGGLILSRPGGHAGIFLAFQTQYVPTDDGGAPTPRSEQIGDLIEGRPAGM